MGILRKIIGENLDALRDFILEANVFPISKIALIESLKNYSLVDTTLQKRAIDLAESLLKESEEILGEEDIIDAGVLSALIEILENHRSTGHIALIKRVYEDHPEIAEFCSLKETLKEINKKRVAKPVFFPISIVEFYLKCELLSRLLGESEDNPENAQDWDDEEWYDEADEEDDDEFDMDEFMKDFDASRKKSNVSPGRIIPFPMQPAKAGRNDPCPCGSGKKHKDCCWNKKIRI